METNTMMLLQIIGVLFGIVMLFITWNYYKKNTYTYRSLLGWFFIWLCFILFVLQPQYLIPVTNVLVIGRLLDVFIIGAIFIFSIVLFYAYIQLKELEKKVDELVSELAKK